MDVGQVPLFTATYGMPQSKPRVLLGQCHSATLSSTLLECLGPQRGSSTVGAPCHSTNYE
eukprot:25675-Amphidinium_carterae.1